MNDDLPVLPRNAWEYGEVGKILVAALLHKHPSAGNRWLANRLAMGHTRSVIRLEGAFSKRNASCGKLSELEKM